jgi:hypothetical protein
MSKSYAEPLERLEAAERALRNTLDFLSNESHLTDKETGAEGLAGGDRKDPAGPGGDQARARAKVDRSSLAGTGLYGAPALVVV